MANILKGLISLAALGFVLAVVGTLAGSTVLGVDPESFSRACSNLALIAIALSLTLKDKSSKS